MTHPITGNGLLSLVADVGSDNKAKLITMAGYVRPDGKLAYTSFYEALILAKNVKEAERLRAAGIITDTNEADDELTPDERILWNHACNALNVDDDDLERIWDDLTDLCTTPSEFDEIYCGSHDGWNPDEEFAQQFVDELGLMSTDHLLYSCVDWDAVWDALLRYDHHKLETLNSSHYFRNI